MVTEISLSFICGCDDFSSPVNQKVWVGMFIFGVSVVGVLSLFTLTTVHNSYTVFRHGCMNDDVNQPVAQSVHRFGPD